MNKYKLGTLPVGESIEVKLRHLEKIAFNQSFLVGHQLIDPPHIDIEQMLDSCREYAVRLSAYIWTEEIAKKTVALSVTYPETWWDAFKEKYFDCKKHWFWKKHQPKYKTVQKKYTFKSIAVYPSLKLNTTDYKCVLHEMILD